MRLYALVVLCACNSTFGIHLTETVDAQYFDAGIDAPFACPPLGQTPTLSLLLHHVATGVCASYNPNAGRAAASCVYLNVYQIVEGPVDGDLLPPAGIPITAGDDVYDQPRLSSDGTTMLVRHYSYSTNAQNELLFQRDANGIWQAGSAPPFATGTDDNVGTSARGPTGDHVIVVTRADNRSHEWAFDGVSWAEVRVQTAGALKVTTLLDVNMSSDGLRAMVYSQEGTTLYADRGDVASDFSEGRPVAGAPPHALDSVMTEDCARLYVTGAGGIWYAQQQ